MKHGTLDSVFACPRPIVWLLLLKLVRDRCNKGGPLFSLKLLHLQLDSTLELEACSQLHGMPCRLCIGQRSVQEVTRSLAVEKLVQCKQCWEELS
jgi:hypothetical protein